MIFEHTCLEPKLWRGWIKNGQSFEISWSPPGSVGFGVRFHACANGTEKFLWLGLGFVQFYIPIGISKTEWEFGDEPGWVFDFSREFGITLRWNHCYKNWSWPFHTILLNRYYEGKYGQWLDMDYKFPEGTEWRKNPGAKKETHPYTYVLRSGEVQERKATIIKEKWIRGRHLLSKIGWPSRIEYTIDVEFDKEVGEKSGSWKGGCVGCGYTINEGETPLDTLRRMEKERIFN